MKIGGAPRYLSIIARARQKGMAPFFQKIGFEPTLHGNYSPFWFLTFCNFFDIFFEPFWIFQIFFIVFRLYHLFGFIAFFFGMFPSFFSGFSKQKFCKRDILLLIWTPALRETVIVPKIGNWKIFPKIFELTINVYGKYRTGSALGILNLRNLDSNICQIAYRFML